MENYCAFSNDHTCLKWLDYVITLQELEQIMPLTPAEAIWVAMLV